MVATMEILSKEMIKPSFPTPHHLRNHKFSLLDQLAPQDYIPLIFFYRPEIKMNVDSTQISQLLKKSLSNILTQYYPLAGRINGNLSLDCNDAGIEYVETRVHAQLAQVIEEPSMKDLKQYLPKESQSEENGTVGHIPLAIQTNFFACGGIAIGVCISHKLADGSSSATFMNAWAATCRGDCSGQNLEKYLDPNNGGTNCSGQNLSYGESKAVQRAIFDMTSHFPTKDISGLDFSSTSRIAKEKIVTKRFVFDKEKLRTLKEAIASATGSQVTDPTRVEAITAFFWRHFIKVADDDNKKLTFAASHLVNLRPRMSPPLPEHAFGNIFTITVALSTPDEDKGYHNLVGKLRDAIRNINGNYVKNIQHGDEYLSSLKKSVESYYNKDIKSCGFSSWCRFPFYEVDYGWGKPVWVSTTSFPYKNYVILMSSRCGEGIEAWVNMLDDDASMLQSNLKLLSLDVPDINS